MTVNRISVTAPFVSVDSSPGRRLSGDAGAALLEFSLLLPFLATFVFGTIDLGRAFSLRNRLTNMSREGAFYAQYYPYNVSGCSPTSITSSALIEDTNVPNATVTVTNAATGTTMTNSCGATPTGGTRVRVRVSSPLTITTPFVGIAVGNTITVTGDTEVVVQG